MTTPKELAEEFRRLAAEAKERADSSPGTAVSPDWWIWDRRRKDFEEAAQMLEERLDG